MRRSDNETDPSGSGPETHRSPGQNFHTSGRGAGHVLPAKGYGDTQLQELGETVRAADCDVVVIGTPVDLSRLVDLGHLVRRVTYELREIGSPTLADVLARFLDKWRRGQAGT